VLVLVLGYVFFPSPWKSRGQMITAALGIQLALFRVFMCPKKRINASRRAAEKAQEQALEPLPVLSREQDALRPAVRKQPPSG
jgi:hypothetical protein